MPPKPKQKVDPEKKLQLAMEKESKMRLMDDYVKNRKLATSYAAWEMNLQRKDKAADLKRMNDLIADDVEFTSKNAKVTRSIKIAQLYAQDDAYYEALLSEYNLTFRKERS